MPFQNPQQAKGTEQIPASYLISLALFLAFVSSTGSNFLIWAPVSVSSEFPIEAFRNDRLSEIWE